MVTDCSQILEEGKAFELGKWIIDFSFILQLPVSIPNIFAFQD
jgi:hypothetical protein